jgi:hypothetical protein
VDETGRPWQLLIHEIPTKPLYLRAKVRGLLAKAGAVALKDSVYLLPTRGGARSELEAIATVAVEGGGDAFLFEASPVDARLERRLTETFQRARSADYQALASEIRRWLGRRQAADAGAGVLRSRLTHARRRLEAIARVDFFDASARGEAEAAIAELESRAQVSSELAPKRRHADLIGRTWVTRHGVQVDRIASAWFVRRFIDPRARFRFLDPGADEIRPGEIRFDMKDGDFTHEGDHCTFETLIARTGVHDPALSRVAEVVHDIDIKDGKFARSEALGVEQLLRGILLTTPDDEGRLESGFALFDTLYHSFAPPSARTRIPSNGP